jgi:hypothetical protein
VANGAISRWPRAAPPPGSRPRCTTTVPAGSRCASLLRRPGVADPGRGSAAAA